MKNSIFYIIMIILFACQKPNNYIQDAYVNIVIDLSLPEYNDLNALGNYMFIAGGNKGLIVYHYALNEYRIYDRNCSYEPSLNCSFIDSISSSIAYCNCCTSAFLLDQDGTAVNSPALLPLKKYNYILENEKLRIFN